MRQQGRFDTDSQALEQRISAHERFGDQDLNQWIFEHLVVDSGQEILDLGCGVGKQSLPLAKSIGGDGRVISVDIAADSLTTLAERARVEGTAERITVVQADLDDVPSRLPDLVIDRAVASYSLYYAQHPRALISYVAGSLGAGGILFFCGPASNNNSELRDFHAALRVGNPGSRQSEASVFMEQIGPAAARDCFDSVEVVSFENPLRFNSSGALHDYWASYNLYDPDLDEAFLSAADRHFSENDVFTTVKRVVGVQAAK